ncbi:MAG: PEP-CTERM sorting domain-containing protein [Planctomycetota bacterium]
MIKNRIRVFGLASATLLSVVAIVDAATYRLVPSEAQVLPGTTIGLRAEVETEEGDNVVGIGYYSFALDLTLTGAAGARGSDISSVLINEADFDDLLNNSLGFPQGNQYLGIAGVTTDIFPPTFGYSVGDVTSLFNFVLAIPTTAVLGDTILITPGEGALENLIANTTFDNVFPQRFESATLTVVPEPTSLVLLAVSAGVIMGAHRRRGLQSLQNAKVGQ